MKITIEKNNTKEIQAELNAAAEKALEMCGLQCEKYAKLKCPVDTGLLRNSITHAVSGHATSISNYHASYGSNKKSSGSSKGKRYSAGSKNAGSVGFGQYSGTVGGSDEKAVYIGTNVEYAPYVEYGTSRSRAQPYLRPAVDDHIEEYRQIITRTLSGK